MTNKDRELLYRVMSLENTRLIFDGIAELHKQIFNGKNGKNLKKRCREAHAKICVFQPDEEIKQRLEKLVEESRDQGGLLLRQNANYSFLSFWEAYFGSADSAEFYQVAYEMILLYDLLQRLVNANDVPDEPHYSRDELPYCYEKLCCYLRKILECDNCFVFHKIGGNGRLICRSPYSKEELINASEFTAEKFSALMERQPKDRVYLTDDIFQITENGELYVIIGLAELDKQREEELVLILQAPKTPESLENNIRPLARILFARERLKEALVMNYEYLLNIRFECSFVQFYNNTTDNSEGLQYPIIMHISDIHMDMLLHSKRDDLLKQMGKSLHDYGPIDLLAISGDLVEAKYSNASQIQENYDCVKVLLREIVTLLWDRGDGRISFDWRRRMLIVPGNHDFAAMNLAKTVFRYRAIAATVPAPGGNKIMAKFAYYLDFMQSFLDAPIDELMLNCINEVREYRCMNTKVLLLNSSVGSTALRTNKVTIDETAVDSLTSSSVWRKEPDDRFYRVCVVHHPPFYKIDYVLDGYDTLEEWKWVGVTVYKTMNSLYMSMKDAIYQLREEKNGHFGSTRRKDRFIREYESMEGDALIRNNLQKAYAKGKTYFTQDAKLLYEYLKRERSFMTEDTANMINRILYDMDTAEDDANTYDKLVKSIDSVDIFLCGHIHADGAIPNIKAGTSKKDRVSIIRKFAYDEWEDDSEKKPHVRIMHPIWEDRGISIETIQY